MSDADTDGSNITSLILLFFVLFMPELIIQGKVYKALPPLLQLEDNKIKKWYKGSMLLYSKEEYYDVINRIISENTEVVLESEFGNHVEPLSKKQCRKWLKMNSEYLFNLDRLEARTACDKEVLEFVCYAKLKSKNEEEFAKMIRKEYPEVEYDIQTNIMSGSINGKYVSLIIDKIFWKVAKSFMNELKKNESLYIYAKNRNEDHDRYDKYTIGEYLYAMNKEFPVRIYDRFKGLGESGAKALFLSALNPKVRKLIRFTVDDMDTVLETFHLLHAKNSDMRQKRRELLDNSQISYMDLDN